MADQTEVNIDSVDQFGNRVMGMLEPFGNAVSAPIQQIADAKLGGSGLSEALYALSRHGRVSAQSATFLSEAATGMGALAFGAMTIAINYRTADLDAQAQMDAVNAAFTPERGQASLSAVQAENPTAMGASTGTLPPPQAEVTDPNDPCELTPEEQVDLHEELWGQDESWRPEPPVILAPGPLDGSPTTPDPGTVV